MPEMSHKYDDEFSKWIRDFDKKIFNCISDFGCEKHMPKKANEYINNIINNTVGKGKSTWSLYVFQKQLNRHFQR
jgi:hypothetical protein